MKKGFVLIVFFLIIGITYKIYLLNKYYVEEVELNKDTIFNQTISIEHKDTEEKTFKYDNMIIKDDFSDWTKRDDYYVLYDENNSVIKAVGITKMEEYYLLLRSTNFTARDGNIDDMFNENDRVRFVNENNINSDIDLFTYIKNNYYLKNTIFDSIKTIKHNYIINTFVSSTLLSDSSTLINGDLIGYINIIKNNMLEIHILYNNEQYIINLIGDDITNNEYVINLLESIKFEKMEL